MKGGNALFRFAGAYASKGEVVTSTEEVKRHKNLGIEARQN